MGGELEEWKPLLKRVGSLIRKGVAMYVDEVEKELVEKSKPPVTKSYTCKQCGATFQRTFYLASHIHSKHPKK